MGRPARHSGRSLRRSVAVLVALGSLVLAVSVGRSLFPFAYRPSLVYWTGVYRLDAALVASVIRNESRFQADAVSRVGAVGLMQIMPETGAWIGAQLGHTPWDPALLEDPHVNIELGCWYLRYLLDRYASVEAALMAYNAGPSNVDRWQGDVTLAFPETRDFVRRVQAHITIYRVYLALPARADAVPSSGTPR